MNTSEIAWVSQSGQDKFAFEACGCIREGSYLEIGAGPWRMFNNTYVLAREFDWAGISVEIDPHYVSEWLKHRPKDTIVHGDATTLNYNGYVDYLSIDIEPAEQSLAVLKRILDQGVRFKALTFEHDVYCSGPAVREESRRLLSEAGYQLARGDVVAPGYGVNEDWWKMP